MDDDRRTVSLTDPSAMRALAHPTRVRLLGELRAHGPQTVGRLSDLVKEAPGAVSYHLGRLSAHGFIEEAPELARNRRERWWRATRTQTMWEPLEDYLGASALAGSKAESGWDSDDVLWLTCDEMAQLREDLRALMTRWRRRGQPGREGSCGVTVVCQAFRRS